MARKVIKHLFAFVFLVVICFGFYLYNLRGLNKEGKEIYAYRCTKVNPLLIGYKNSFLSLADAMNNQGKYTEQEINNFWEGYDKGLEKYATEESIWLNKQSAYISSLNFKLFAPWYMKQGLYYEWKMFEGFRDEAKYSLNIVKLGKEKLTESESKAREAKDRKIEFGNKFYEILGKFNSSNDLRKKIINFDFPKQCNEGNMKVPDTSGSINWEGKPTPSLFPVIPELVS